MKGLKLKRWLTERRKAGAPPGRVSVQSSSTSSSHSFLSVSYSIMSSDDDDFIAWILSLYCHLVYLNNPKTYLCSVSLSGQ